jgi:hypothetical protein
MALCCVKNGTYVKNGTGNGLYGGINVKNGTYVKNGTSKEPVA